MEALSLLQLAFFCGIIVMSYSIRGSAGFGGVTIPLLVWIVSIKVVVPLVTVLGLISSLGIMRRDWNHISWPDLRRVMPSCVIGVIIGIYFFKILDAQVLAKGLGILVVAYGIYGIAGTFLKPRPVKLPIGIVSTVAGALAGFIGTIFGSLAGVILAIYLDLLKHPRVAFRATIAAALVGFGICRTTGYIVVGEFDREVMLACAYGIPAMAIGNWIGNRLHSNLNDVVFRRFIAIVLMLTGLPLIFT